MPENGPTSFPTTRWTLILDLQGGSETQREHALEELCQLYWYPIYAYVRQVGKPPEEAQDLTQSFFSQFLQADAFDRADADKGKLRSYLLGSVKRHLAKEWRKESAQKRGNHPVTLSIDQGLAEDRISSEVMNGVSPEKAYDRRWAQTILESVESGLRAEYSARGRGTHFEALSDYLFWNSGEPAYAEVAKKLDMTEPAVRQAVVRMRKRYGTLLRDQVSFTVDSAAMVDEEVRELFAAFRPD